MPNQKCSNESCGEGFSYSIIGGGVPGGKEMEELLCPYCGHVVDREMMSGSFLVSKIKPTSENRS